VFSASNPGATVRRNFTVFDIWEKLGVTEHLGGIKATKHLIDLCGIIPGQFVLDMGCGTGYMAYAGYGLYVGRKI
jgi:ubiquinone/menaquinone biosynthesis C-methylase UbiE